MSGPIKEGDPIEPCHLASFNIRTLKVGVQQNVEIKWRLLAGVVNTDIQMQLLFSEDDPVRDSELVLPH